MSVYSTSTQYAYATSGADIAASAVLSVNRLVVSRVGRCVIRRKGLLDQQIADATTVQHLVSKQLRCYASEAVTTIDARRTELVAIAGVSG